MSLLSGIIVTYNKKNVITKLKKLYSSPRNYRLRYFWKNLVAPVIYIYILRMGANYSLKSMLCWSYSSSLCTVFDFISSNIDEVLSIIPSANVFVLETLTFIIRTGLPILVELIDLVKAVISNNLTQIANFPSHISDCDSHSPALLDLFLFFWC